VARSKPHASEREQRPSGKSSIFVKRIVSRTGSNDERTSSSRWYPRRYRVARSVLQRRNRRGRRYRRCKRQKSRRTDGVDLSRRRRRRIRARFRRSVVVVAPPKSRVVPVLSSQAEEPGELPSEMPAGEEAAEVLPEFVRQGQARCRRLHRQALQEGAR